MSEEYKYAFFCLFIYSISFFQFIQLLWHLFIACKRTCPMFVSSHGLFYVLKNLARIAPSSNKWPNLFMTLPKKLFPGCSQVKNSTEIENASRTYCIVYCSLCMLQSCPEATIKIRKLKEIERIMISLSAVDYPYNFVFLFPVTLFL